MEKEIRFGIIGCGEIGQSLGGKDTYNGVGEWHASAISQLEGAKLIAVADIKERNASALSEKFAVDTYFLDYHQLLKRDDIDVVNVCTPSGTHGDIAIDIARAGKHVIVEKPMEVTLEKAEKVIEECERANVKLCAIFPHRFAKSIRKLKEAVKEGKLGKIILGNAMCRRYRTQEYYSSSGWRGTWAFDGGGALMNQGIHIIDTFLYVMGEVSSVFGRMETLGHSDLEVEDVAIATVKFQSGALGIIEGTTCAYPDFGDRIDIHAEKGSVVLEGLPPQLKRWEVIDSKEKIEGLKEESDPIYGHRLQIKDMIEAIRDDRQPLVNGREGRKAIRVIQAIYQSARTGREVNLIGGGYCQK